MFRKRKSWMVLAVLMVAAVLITSCQGVGVKKSEFVFGVVLVGPYNDHGWSEAHYQAGKYVEQKIPGAKMIYFDKLNPADRKGTTLEQVVEELVSQGAKMIFTTSDDFQADTDVVAAKYPKIPFLMISGDHAKSGKAPKNVANYMGRMEYMKAVAGCAAALRTQTKTVAYLGPVINDETRRLAASAYLGCRECYEKYRGGKGDDIKFMVNWIGFWFNIPGVTLDPTEVSNQFFNSGADVILSGIDTTEAIVVAGQRADKGAKVWAIPYDFEGACDVKPNICLGTPYFNWGPAYVRYVKAVQENKFKQGWEWEGPNWKNVNDHDTSAVGFKYGAALTDQDKKNLEEYMQSLATGKAKFFVGPLALQDGTEYLKDGEKATDDKIWYLPQLVKGMQGASK
jgi:simple sugar transport system substrate-binding protein